MADRGSRVIAEFYRKIDMMKDKGEYRYESIANVMVQPSHDGWTVYRYGLKYIAVDDSDGLQKAYILTELTPDNFRETFGLDEDEVER